MEIGRIVIHPNVAAGKNLWGRDERVEGTNASKRLLTRHKTRFNLLR